MAESYTPGLEISSLTTISKIRELPLPGEALVNVGDKVTASSSVLKADLPGDLSIIPVANRMGLEPTDLAGIVNIKAGSEISQGDIVARVKTFFGLYTAEFISPISGTVEFYTEANTHLGLRQPPVPLSVSAYISGTVTEVEPGKSVTIETKGAFIQGIFGVGGERHGEILALDITADKIVNEETLRSVQKDLSKKILIGGAQFTTDAISYAASQGVAAIVTGSIDAEVLSEYIGFELGVSITGDEDIPTTLIITEGFGNLPISSRVIELSKELDGSKASVNGATQVRAGAMRPEIIIPRDKEKSNSETPTRIAGKLEPGTKVRIIRVPYFGEFATVTELPHEPEKVPSGAVVRVLRAKLDSGEVVTVPRANVEIVS